MSKAINQPFTQLDSRKNQINDQRLQTTGSNRYLETGDLVYKSSGFQLNPPRPNVMRTATNTNLDTRMISCKPVYRNELFDPRVISRPPLKNSVAYAPTTGYSRGTKQVLVDNEFKSILPEFDNINLDKFSKLN